MAVTPLNNVMDYRKIHDTIVTKAIGECRKNGCGTYYELHHITPRCMGGPDTCDNLVLLTAREHYVIHVVLVKLYPKHKGITRAAWMLANTRDGRTSSRTYQRIKLLLSEQGTSEETKEKIRLTKLGLVQSQATIALRVAKTTGQRRSAAQLETMRRGMLGKNAKFVYVIDGKEYKSVSEVGRIYGIHRDTVVQRCTKDTFPKWSRVPLLH